MTPRELETAVRELLAQRLPDNELRDRLERLANDEISFSGLTWLWGPELYRRNRLLFRPFITSRFSTFMILPKWRSERIRWKSDKASILEAWLTEVDRNDDADLFRRLYEWKLNESFGWTGDKRSRTIAEELLKRFRAASTPAQRQMVLRKFELWFELDEQQAADLYQVDGHSAGPFILKHLKGHWFSGENKRALWNRLIQLADARGDQDFRWKLYRRQIPLAEWIRDCLSLCDRQSDASELVRELEKRHPEGWAINLAEGFFQLVQRRGRDVFPYVMRHLRQVWRGWLGRGDYGKMVDYARAKGWWDLWSALIRTCANPSEFNKELRTLLQDKTTPEPEILGRLLALGGVSREWNWGGFGIATVHQLEEPIAMLFYERFPDLLRGAFKQHLQSHLWGQHYPALLQRFIQAGDDEMVDFLASRLATRSGRWGNAQKMLADAEKLADYYTRLKSDEAVFSRRAASVLSQIPAFSIGNYNELIRENRLARLLFERSASSYLADPRSMADLVEGSEIHVMALAYRALGLDDERARVLAAQHLPLLLGTLLRPLQRATRTLAFAALANAANTPETAALVLSRARDALNLPDVRYPKEKLLGLIGRLLRRWPELRSAQEQPVVYERTAA